MSHSLHTRSDAPVVVDEPGAKHPPLRAAVAVGLALAAGVALVLALFVSAAVKARPTGVAIDVVGPAAAAAQVQAALSAAGEDAFTVTPVADEGAAVAHLGDRSADGAIVLGPDGPRVLTASAGSPVLAQLLSTAAAELSGQPPRSVATDVVPLPAGDPRGVGIASATFPMIIAGLAAGALAALRFRRTAARLLVIATASVASGLLFAGVLDWLGVLDGRYWAVAAAITLAAGAAATFVSGMVAVLGVAGLGVAGLVLMIIGNPLAGAATSPKLVPAPWGTLGQLLPPGAGGTLLRNAAYFPQASVWTPVLVLCGWMAIGAACLAVARRRAAAQPAGR